jgi:hypothetical protein
MKKSQRFRQHPVLINSILWLVYSKDFGVMVRPMVWQQASVSYHGKAAVFLDSRRGGFRVSTVRGARLASKIATYLLRQSIPGNLHNSEDSSKEYKFRNSSPTGTTFGSDCTRRPSQMGNLTRCQSTNPKTIVRKKSKLQSANTQQSSSSVTFQTRSTTLPSPSSPSLCLPPYRQ